jgi:excisionase family DNA binding protein
MHTSPKPVIPPAKPPQNSKLLTSRREAAEKLSICVRTVDYLIAGGKVETVRIGRRVLIKTSSIERLMKDGYVEGRSHNGAA